MTDYCTTAEALALVPYMSITATSQPNTTQAANIVTSISAELDGIMRGNGWTLPITDSNVLAFMKTAAMYGVAGAFLRARPGFGGQEAVDTAGLYERRYREGKQILASQNFSPSIYYADDNPFGSGFPDMEDESDQPWVTRATEF